MKKNGEIYLKIPQENDFSFSCFGYPARLKTSPGNSNIVYFTFIVNFFY